MITFIIEWNMYTKFPDFGVHFIWKVTPGWSWSFPHLPPPHHPKGTSYLASSDLAFALWSEEDSYGIMFCFCFWRFSQGGKWFIALSSFSGHFDPFRTCEKEFRIFNIDVPTDFPELFRVFFFQHLPIQICTVLLRSLPGLWFLRRNIKLGFPIVDADRVQFG